MNIAFSSSPQNYTILAICIHEDTNRITVFQDLDAKTPSVRAWRFLILFSFLKPAPLPYSAGRPARAMLAIDGWRLLAAGEQPLLPQRLQAWSILNPRSTKRHWLRLPIDGQPDSPESMWRGKVPASDHERLDVKAVNHHLPTPASLEHIVPSDKQHPRMSSLWEGFFVLLPCSQHSRE